METAFECTKNVAQTVSLVNCLSQEWGKNRHVTSNSYRSAKRIRARAVGRKTCSSCTLPVHKMAGSFPLSKTQNHSWSKMAWQNFKNMVYSTTKTEDFLFHASPYWFVEIQSSCIEFVVKILNVLTDGS